MITAIDCLNRYGKPIPQNEAHYMGILDLSIMVESAPHVPRRIYCNQDLHEPLHQVFVLIAARELGHLIRTWDGCFNPRPSKGNRYSWSLHAWGLAVDLNAAWNAFDKKPTMPSAIVTAFEQAGFQWGGRWHTPDGMHFQLAAFPA